MNNDFFSAESVLGHCDAIIYCKDKDYKYVRVNQGFKDTIAAEFFGKTDADFFSDPEFLAWISMIDHKVMETGEAQLNIHESAPNSDGSVTHVISNKYPIKDENGKTVGLFGVTVPNPKETSKVKKYFQAD